MQRALRGEEEEKKKLKLNVEKKKEIEIKGGLCVLSLTKRKVPTLHHLHTRQYTEYMYFSSLSLSSTYYHSLGCRLPLEKSKE